MDSPRPRKEFLCNIVFDFASRNETQEMYSDFLSNTSHSFDVEEANHCHSYEPLPSPEFTNGKPTVLSPMVTDLTFHQQYLFSAS